MHNVLILLCMPEKCTPIEVFLGIFCENGRCEVETWAPLRPIARGAGGRPHGEAGDAAGKERFWRNSGIDPLCAKGWKLSANGEPCGRHLYPDWRADIGMTGDWGDYLPSRY